MRLAPRLFDQLAEFQDDVYRNVAERRTQAVDPFDDLAEGDESLSDAAHRAEQRVRQDRTPGEPETVGLGLTYQSIVTRPFERDIIFPTRYSDGSFPVWYGSLDRETTIYETAYHMIRMELAVEGISQPIVRQRSIYQVFCEALLIDLSEKRDLFPQLVSDDYGFTNQIGARLKHEGHPAALFPSARCEGTNIVVFNPIVLSNPRPNSELRYVYDPEQLTVTVEGLQSNPELVISGDRWF